MPETYTVTVEKTLIWKVDVTATNPSKAKDKAISLPEESLGEPDTIYRSANIF